MFALLLIYAFVEKIFLLLMFYIKQMYLDLHSSVIWPNICLQNTEKHKPWELNWSWNSFPVLWSGLEIYTKPLIVFSLRKNAISKWSLIPWSKFSILQHKERHYDSNISIQRRSLLFSLTKKGLSKVSHFHMLLQTRAMDTHRVYSYLV